MTSERSYAAQVVRADEVGLILCGAFLSLGMIVAKSQPHQVLIPLLVTLFIVISIRKPGFIFAAYLYIPFYKGIVDPVAPVDITPLLAATSFLLALPLLLAIPLHSLSGLRVAFSLWTGLLALIFAGTFYAVDFQLALTNAIEFFLLVYLPCLLALRIAVNPRLQAQFLAGTLLLSAIVIVLAVVKLESIGGYERVSTLGANTIATGQAAILIPLIGSAIYGSAPILVRSLLILLMPLGVVAAAASGSRGPLLIAALSLLLVTAVLNHNRLRSMALGIPVVFASVLLFQLPAVQALIPYAAMTRITQLVKAVVNGDVNMLDTSSTARLRLFEFAAQMFRASPMKGHGTGSFEAAASRAPGFEVYIAPHNLPLHFAAEFGVFGVLLLLVFIAAAIRGGVRSLPEPTAVPFLLLGAFAALYSLIDLDIYGSRWFWGILLVLIALPQGAPVRSLHRT